MDSRARQGKEPHTDASLADAPAKDRLAAPGKRPRSAPAQRAPSPTAVQRKPAGAASPGDAASLDWTDVAFRPDIHDAPVQRAAGGDSRSADSDHASPDTARPARGEAVNAVQRKSDPSLARTPVQRAAVQRKTVKLLNFHRLADQIHEAIDGLGTDEEAVYSALSALGHDKSNIDELQSVYKAKFGRTLKSDIQDDFSGSELAHALSLLKPKASAKADDKTAPKGPDYDKLAEKIHTAVDGMGTDEEAVYSALSSLNGDSAKLTKLAETYKSKYKCTLRSDLMDDFSGDELKHVLELLGERSTSEAVNVANDDEAEKAAAIIKRIYVNYGIDVNSQAGIDAIRKDYDKVPDSVRDSLKTTAWEYRELVALEKALKHFAPILGSKRKDSTRGGDQEITTVSKVDQAIDENTKSGVLDTTTLGEYFEDSTNFSMFTAGETSSIDFSDNNKQLEATAVHEIAHGLMEYALSDYISELEYWDSKSKKSGKAGAEAPITDYGSTNASEDLAEAVMYFFVDRNTLKTGKSGKTKGQIGNPCPVRDAFVEATVKKWKKENKD